MAGFFRTLYLYRFIIGVPGAVVAFMLWDYSHTVNYRRQLANAADEKTKDEKG